MIIMIRDNKIRRLKIEKGGQEIKMIKIMMTQLLNNLSRANKIIYFSKCWINSNKLMVVSLILIIEVLSTNKIFKNIRDWSKRVLGLNILRILEVFLLFHKIFLKNNLKLWGLNSMII